jgi:FlaA1/EpsC-like NDP-sugar epimerase
MILKGAIVRNRYVLFADIFVIALSAWMAFALRFGWLFMETREEFPAFLAAAILLKVPAFFAFGMYARYWRYAGFWDLMAVVVANAGASLLLALVMIGLRLGDLIPGLSRSVLPLDALMALAMTTAVRASVRILAESMSMRPAVTGERVRNVLIIGAGDAGALVAREMQKNPELGLRPIAFLDDDDTKLKKRIYGIPVLGGIGDLGRIAAHRHIDEVVIAIPRAGGAVVREVAESCRKHGLPSKTMPGLYELLDGQVGVSRLRELDIADLLRRPQVAPVVDPPEFLSDATVLITGAGGSIGSELCRQVAHAGPAQLVLLGHGENSIFAIEGELRTRFPGLPVRTVIADVRDRDRIGRVFQAIKPDVVFHAAAHKHVPLMEMNIAEAITNNVLGTRNLTEAAAAAGTPRLVLISTDKAVAPSTVMGASKRIAEMIVRDAARRTGKGYVVVRFGNVLGSRGSVVPVFKAQIERGGPITVTHPEVRRYFMTIPEAVHLVLQAGGLGNGGELFVLDMGEPVLLREMAADMIRLSGFDPDEIPIVFTGLRPGEKLDELLCEPNAEMQPTAKPEIRRVNEKDELPSDRLSAFVERLIEEATRDEGRALRLLQEAISTASLTARPETWGRGPDPGRVLRMGLP